ncbi:MAG: hypothetical protein R2867_26645 [Caldilineaceae bacterium]
MHNQRRIPIIRRHPLAYILIVLTALCATTLFITQKTPNQALANGIQWAADNPAAALAAAMHQAERAGRYDYSTDVIQTERFANRIENIGRSDKVTRLAMHGNVDLPAKTTQLSIAAAGKGTTSLKVVDGVPYEQQTDGSWQQLQEQINSLPPKVAPSGCWPRRPMCATPTPTIRSFPVRCNYLILWRLPAFPLMLMPMLLLRQCAPNRGTTQGPTPLATGDDPGSRCHVP